MEIQKSLQTGLSSLLDSLHSRPERCYRCPPPCAADTVKMQPQRASLRLAAAFLSVCTLASAWPGWLPEANALVARQDSGGTCLYFLAPSFVFLHTKRPPQPRPQRQHPQGRPRALAQTSRLSRPRQRATRPPAGPTVTEPDKNSTRAIPPAAWP